ncbi:acyltransferase family protein [Galbibacter sp. EGI 63066]|uniref:acyltransferase family protein n=1 Tax=Galbibacter sp. EGI 63066 TaxID=2993559 RepID=UPI0022489AD1|nr:acyltransferase family protein [Galbibacter sp. EGI 63066]MCX2681661.1 acyltransferase family protein [Galbibacter sp. EGI 63066]
MDTTKRRYDLDWLRVIAILAVYFHHLGMPFNGDDFHIMNSESSKLLDDIMVYFEQFRLPLLFLISGTGTVLAFSKRTWKQFFKERTGRLLIPLFFGVLFIVPPQTYYQYFNEFNSYWQIYTEGRFETNHLWFIENLYVISIIVIPLIIFLKSQKSNRFRNWFEKMSSYKIGFLLGGLPLIILTAVLKRYYPTGSSSLTNLSETFFYTYFFVSGILFATSQIFWGNLKKFRRFHFVVFIVSSLLFYGYYLIPNNMVEPYLSLSFRWDIWYGLCCLLGWSFVLTILGYGQVYFNKPSLCLKRMNEAIYPFYILHQTVIVVFAYYIIKLDLNIPAKLIILLISSFLMIVFIYRFFIYPFKITRILFGMKKYKNKS